MTNNVKVKGRIELIEDGKIVRAFDNMIMWTPFVNIMNMFLGTSMTTPIMKYCAVGTGTTAVTHNDTQLATELDRVYFTNKYRTGYQIVSEFVFTKAEGNGVLTELGFFLNGSTTANSGTLWARALISPSYTKTSDKELIIRRIDTWSKG